ncbi:MAG: FG-GAP-like repeat-containing protein [Pirellulaceae bacterium]
MTNQRPAKKKQKNAKVASAKNRWLKSLLCVVIVCAAIGVGVPWWLAESQAEQRLRAAVQAGTKGDLTTAYALATEAWKLDPDLHSAGILMAQFAVANGEFERAAAAANQLITAEPQADVETRLAAFKLLAQVNHYRFAHLTAAEQAYRQGIDLAPQDVELQAGLANLLGLCGRRTEAIPHVLNLIRLGQAGDLLMLLAKEDGVINDVPLLETGRRNFPNDPLPLLGLAWHAANRNEFDHAQELLQSALGLDPQLVAARVQQVKLLADQNHFDAVLRWEAELGDLADSVEKFSEIWIARGRTAEYYNQLPLAIRCYAEAAKLSPEARMPNARLAQLLARLNQPAAAKRFAVYSQELQTLRDIQDRIFFSDGSQGLDALLELIGSYEDSAREWEALGWCQLAKEMDPTHPVVNQRIQELTARGAALPPQLVDPAKAPVGDLDLASYPLPDRSSWQALSQMASRSDNGAIPDTTGRLAFVDTAVETGLDFNFLGGTDGQPERRMYEFSGGGIGVLDYDLDGWPDVCLTQGVHWPPGSTTPDKRDVLMRNMNGRAWMSVPLALADDGFGQGVTVGDYDADGFPDLYVAQIGGNRLLRNNGDGTFVDVTAVAGIEGSAWTTSCVMADLDGDALPDIYDVNYVQGDDVFDRICADATGHPTLCMPFDFDAALDQLWINNGVGGFDDRTSALLQPPPLGKGLGVVAINLSESTLEGPRPLSLFIANDTTPNFLFQLADDGTLQEQAITAGLALDDSGKPEGCMGIAVGDVNQDGRSDLLVTNFLNESNTCYVNLGAGMFTDRTTALGLTEPSLNVLGFGTQFLDVDLDGRLELFVANGHIDDLRRLNRPYEMQAQLFTLADQQFQLVELQDRCEYFRRNLLGRAAAKIDWNRDGLEDLLVGHLRSNYALLTNTTAAAGRSLRLRLIGTHSNRDAIGAQVTLIIGQRQLTSQLSAGDGYQSSNQRLLVFGCGVAEQVDQIEVRWPSGTISRVYRTPTNSEITLIEGQQ